MKIHNIILVSILVIILCFLIARIIDEDYVEIEQDVRIDDYYPRTYFIKTKVWVRNWYGFSESLEYSKYAVDIPERSLEKMKKREYNKALYHYNLLKDYLED